MSIERYIYVVDYIARIKKICDSLASINVTVEKDEIVQVCLTGLASKFEAFQIAACTKEITPSFFQLHSMFLVEENHRGVLTSKPSRCCMRRKIGYVDVVDAVGWHAMEAVDKSRTKGTEVVSTAVSDPPRAGRVTTALEGGKGRP